MWREKYEQIFILLLAAIQFEKHPFVEGAIFSTVCVFCFFVEKKYSVCRWVNLYIHLQFYSIDQHVCFDA